MLGGDIKYKYLKLTVLICYYTFSSIGYIKKIKYLIRYIKLVNKPYRLCNNYADKDRETLSRSTLVSPSKPTL